MSCKTINIDLANVPPVPLQIGVAGENAFRTITFDASKWGADYPDATYTVVYKRADGYLYPVLVNASADAIVWNPTDIDTAVSGNGQLEVRLLDGETVGKTIIMQTFVAPSLTGDESEPSRPAPDWVNDVADDADRAEAAVSHYPRIQNGTWWVWDVANSEWVDTGVSARGPVGETGDSAYEEAVAHGFEGTEAEWLASLKGGPGDPGTPGVSPTVAVASIEGGNRVTITDAAHPTGQTFDVMDGVDGRSPAITVTAITGGHRVTITDETHPFGQSIDVMDGDPGADYVLTPQDKAEIAGMVPVPTVPTEDISANTAARHTHENKAVLDGITAAKVQSWDGKGTYSKPSGGIPASDLASGVIPSVPQMATNPNMSDWTSGKTVDAAVLKTGFMTALRDLRDVEVQLEDKADTSDIPTAVSDLANDSGYQTAAQVQTVVDAAAATKANSATGSNGAADMAVSIPFGKVDSTSTATVFTATVSGITELRDGVCMWLSNGVITSASGFTINVNGLGAKPCYNSLAAATRATTVFNVNYTMLLIYNSTRVEGGCWDIVYGYDSNTTYTPQKLGFGYAVCTTAAATAAKTASISSYALTTGGIVSIKFDNDVPSGATLNVSSKGAKAMYYRGAAITAGVIKAGDTATFVYSTYYHLISIDRDESGDDLPSVTASDNGKFLRVVNGAWTAETVQIYQGGSY